MERVDVPERRMIAICYDVELLLLALRNESAAGLSLVEELALAHLVRFGVMADEDDLDAAVLRGDELVEQEEEAAREIFLHGVHGPRRVHDAHDDGVRLAADVGRDVAVNEVALVERKAPVALGRGLLQRCCATRGAWRSQTPLRCELALHPRFHGTVLVETDADADGPVAAPLAHAQRL